MNDAGEPTSAPLEYANAHGYGKPLPRRTHPVVGIVGALIYAPIAGFFLWAALALMMWDKRGELWEVTLILVTIGGLAAWRFIAASVGAIKAIRAGSSSE